MSGVIFVTLGTQKFQLNRLLRALDNGAVCGDIHDVIVAQAGYSDYEPQSFRVRSFLGKEEFDAYLNQAEVIISHGGVGSIIKALQIKKPVIVFPRLVKYNEHVDDHQVEIARVFADKGYVLFCGESDDLPLLIEKAKTHSFNTYVSQTDRFVELIEEFLHNNFN